jgi:predicted PurR-regulated permease PerM
MNTHAPAASGDSNTFPLNCGCGLHTFSQDSDLYSVPTAMNHIASKTAIVYLVLLAMTGLIVFIYLIRSVILQLTIALILTVALEPLVGLLMRRGIRRSVSIAISVTFAALAILFVVGIIATPLITEGMRLSRNAPQIIEQVTNNDTFKGLNDKYHMVDKAKQYAREMPGQFTERGLPALGVIASVTGSVSSFAVIMVLTLFLILEGPPAWQAFLTLFPAQIARQLQRTSAKAAIAVSGFVSGNLLISLIAGTVTLITLLILRVPYPFALAALVALFDLIPLIGAAIATIVVGLVALTTGIGVAIVAVAVLLVYQFVEGHFIQTIVYSRSISLSPLLVIVASLAGAELGGIIGVLLAIPVSAVLQVIVVDIFATFRNEAPL